MDLDEDLLALAAGSEEEEEQNDNSYSEQEEEENEDDYYEEEEAKTQSSRKKRKIVTDDEDDDDDGLKNPYPLEGKFKNEEDRDKIMAMDDLERELILFERSQELDRFQERKYLELRAKKDKLNEEERKRSSRKGKTNTKADKRELLRQQRRKAQNRRRGYDDDDDELQDEDDEDQDKDDEDEYQVEDDYDYGFADLKHDREPEKETTLQDINNIHIGRKLFDKYSYYPEFADTVMDCYAKVNLGPNKQTGQDEYRMVQIKNIIERKEKPYTLVNKKTTLYAVVSIGKSERTIPMNIFSDRPITSQEFKWYTDRLLKDHLELLSLRRISDKYYRLREMARRNLTDKEITDMISKREEIENDFAGVNHVIKKTNLQQQRIVALENEDFDTADKLEQELKAMEEATELARANQKLANEQVLERVNERNKKLNQELVRKAELRAMELKLNHSQKDDPFSRLKTRTKMFYTGGTDKTSLLEESAEEKLARIAEEKELLELTHNEKLFAKFRDYYNGFDDTIKSIGLSIDIDV